MKKFKLSLNKEQTVYNFSLLMFPFTLPGHRISVGNTLYRPREQDKTKQGKEN